MAKKKLTINEQYLKEVSEHYNSAKAELDVRVTHKSQGFDEYDNLYRSYIKPEKWAFNSKIFIPLAFTSLFGKGTRLISGKVKGRLKSTQFGNSLGAAIGTELLDSQYEDHDYYFEEPMISKWFRMDQNARKYGAGFGLCGWKTEYKGKEQVYDGPTFEVLDNRKVYTEPTATSVSDSNYFIVERYQSLAELKRANEGAKKAGKDPFYVNLDKLEEASGDSYSSYENQSRNRALRSLDDTSTAGMTGDFKKFRVLTEWRRDKMIKWIPNVGSEDNGQKSLGTVIQVADNPYKVIPIIRLIYAPIDDDIYGVSELEAGRSMQKAMNALTSGFIEAVSLDLYPIVKGKSTDVNWNTIEFKPKAVWLMNNPQTDIVRLEGARTFTSSFVQAFQLLDSKFASALGDSTADSSQRTQFEGSKTATEIKDTALQRGSRDNWNKLMLSSAITKMYQLWWEMDQKFITEQKVIRISGRQALKYFAEQGLDREDVVNDEGEAVISNFMAENTDLNYEEARQGLMQTGGLDGYTEPLYPTQTDDGIMPKLRMEEDQKSAYLTIEPEKDLFGSYRYSVDLNTIGEQDEVQGANTLRGLIQEASQYEQQFMQEGYSFKFKDAFARVLDKVGQDDPDMLFEEINVQEQQMADQQVQMQQGMDQPIDSQNILQGGLNGIQ